MSLPDKGVFSAARQLNLQQSIVQMPSANSMDKENMTADIGALGGTTKKAAFGEWSSKKLRSRSIGPGSLDASKETTENRRKSIAVPAPRSILKSTMHREISSYTATYKQSTESPNAPKGLATPKPWQAPSTDAGAPVSGIAALSNPFTSEANAAIAETRVLLRTEEEQQAASREREAKENLETEDDINKRREARRKSLANRRVSFAPEATLHTWDVVEYLQDSTTSSASTNSTRRASTASTGTVNSPRLETQSPTKPETTKQQHVSSEHVHDSRVSSTGQQGVDQKKRRRSSAIPHLDSNNSDDEPGFFSPSSDGSTTSRENDRQISSNGESDDISDSNSNSEDEDTAMSLDIGDNTEMSVKSNTSSNESSTRLDEVLQEAIRRAEIQGLEFKDHKVVGFAEEKVVSGQPESEKSVMPGLIPSNDQEAYFPIFKTASVPPTHQDHMSMQATQADCRVFPVEAAAATVVNAIPALPTDSNDKRRKSGTIDGRHSLKKRPSLEESLLQDDTMDLTAAFGSIQQTINDVDAKDRQSEDVTMEFTSTIGDVLTSVSTPESKHQTPPVTSLQPSHNRTSLSAMRIVGDDTMDITTAIGGILTEDVQSTVFDDNSTVRMEMTAALGGILPGELSTGKCRTGYGLEEQASRDSPTKKAPVSSTEGVNETIIASEAGSPNLASRIVLTPQKKNLSGFNFDQAKLGSPRVADILNKRQSISDMALTFKPGETGGIKYGVRFENSEVIELDHNKKRQKEMDCEDGRKTMEREADTVETERDATLTLKEMIESLTPKKRPLKGRKSLHIGAAKGILGKRPVELDEDDEETDEDVDGIKRLRTYQGSPVKSVKLQASSLKAEATRNNTRATRRSVETPNEKTVASTPQSDSQRALTSTPKRPVEDPIPTEEAEKGERMHLQDFLNMTSIRFMELTTTKRRHTVVVDEAQKGTVGSKANSDPADHSFESCIVAGACTVPMLELFQHSCRELKKYISEGRNIVREIEKETFEENPPLFNEYISAAPDVRALMDNQFKNVKTHARLLSKAMWYEWRMELLDGLKVGLRKINEGMNADAKILHAQQELLDSILPSLITKHGKLSKMESDLRKIAEELASCNKEELSEARQRLASVETATETKRKRIYELQEQLREKESMLAATLERRQSCLDDIQAAEKIREACRGWSANEGLAFKARVDDLERQHGWTITGVSGNQVSMTYRREIELVFDATSFKPNGSGSGSREHANSTIDLWYIASNRELNSLPLTTLKEFFLQNIRDYCRSLPQNKTSVKALLDTASASWMTALETINDIQSLTHNCPTEITRASDTSIVVYSSLLLCPLATKVRLEFHIHLDSTQNGLKFEVRPQCNVAYGERFNEPKIGEFLLTRITEGENKKSWADIVAELQARLLARGRK